MPGQLGLDGKAYRLTTGPRVTWGAADANGIHVGAAPASLDEVGAVKDLSFNLTKGKADLSKRLNQGWAAKRGTLKEGSVEIKAVWDPADLDLQAFLKSWLTNTSIALAILDGDKATTGTTGLWADFECFDINKDEPLVEGQMATFTFEPADTTVPPEWVKVS